MKSNRVILFALSMGLAVALTCSPSGLRAEDGKVEPVRVEPVKLEGPTMQELLGELFGTPTSDGLLDGTRKFDFRAEDVVLTREEADMFFAPSATNDSDFTDLVAAAKLIKGVVVRIEGKLDDAPFEFQMSGKQLKAEGLVLTQAEFDALVDQLKSTPGLHEAKIEATVDGELLTAKLQNVPGKVKIEHRGFVEGPTPTPHIDQRAARSKSDAQLAVSDRSEHAGRPEKVARPEKLEKIERPEKIERIERPEKIERVERLEKLERIERPEVAHSGKGRG